MAFNIMTFKKAMLAWDPIAKKAPADIKAFGEQFKEEHPEAVPKIAEMAKMVSTMNTKLKDLLDKVVNAKDDATRASAAKAALANVKQYDSYVASSHLPPNVQTNLKNGLAQLAKGLA